jgi:3-oxoadipate enol-lactonase
MRWIDANGISIRWTLEGTGGPAVVLLHEMGGTLESWDEVVPALVAAGYRVLRFDQRGCGGSEKPRGGITARELTDDLTALLGGVGLGPEPCHFVGVAASCVQLLTLAAERPGQVASMTLCNPALGVSPDRAAALEARAAATERDGMRAALAATLDRSWPAGLGDALAYQRYRGRYLGNDPVTFAALNRALIGSSVSAIIPAVRGPVMVLAGRHDQVRPPEASQQLAARFAGARFEIVDSGHMMPAQAPAAVARLLVDFVTTVDAEAGENRAAVLAETGGGDA